MTPPAIKSAAATLGSIRTPAKAKASRENGRKRGLKFSASDCVEIRLWHAKPDAATITDIASIFKTTRATVAKIVGGTYGVKKQ
jgi:hypothetical protein